MGVLSGGFLIAGEGLKLELKKAVEVGRHGVVLRSITSVCEDRQGNFYLLDRKAYRVYKFSPLGRLILSFGRRGKGPGDFAYPHHISCEANGNVVVSEEVGFFSIFDGSGKFIRRIPARNGLGVIYINDEMFYGWHWKRDLKEQVFFNKEGRVFAIFFKIPVDSFSVTVTDKTGRSVMFNYFIPEYTPHFLFSMYDGLFALGVSNEYDILLINRAGRFLGQITRKVEPPVISSEEREILRKRIMKLERIPDFVRKKIAKKIPRHKNYFYRMLLCKNYLFLFRVPDNIEDKRIPVDVFTLSGRFLGTGTVTKIPAFVSDRYFYTVEEENEKLLLVKYAYKIRLRQ